MRTYRAATLLEGLIGLVLFSTLVLYGTAFIPKSMTGTREEAAVIFMGVLNEEMRNSMETMKVGKVGPRTGVLLHIDSSQRIKKRTSLGPGVDLYFQSIKNPEILLDPGFTFRFFGMGTSSGKLSFYEKGVMQSSVMIHLGTLTMDIRNP